MKLKLVFALVCAFAIQTSIFSQQLNVKKIKDQAEGYYAVEDYILALPLFEKLDSIAPNVAEYKYKLGVCYYHSHHKRKCLPYFVEAKSLYYHHDDLDFYIGRGHHLNHDFNIAIEHYESFKAGLTDTTILKQINRHIEMCHTGKELVADSLGLVIENLGPEINTQYPEYAPVISADETVMIFTARRPNTTGEGKDPADGLFFEDVYISYKDSTGKWTKSQDMGPHVNSKVHDASVGISPDGQKLFIYRSGVDRKNFGDLFVSNLVGNSWETPVIMKDGINTKSWEPSATISADEKTIYFSSDRPGGYGGSDIYMVRMQEGSQWGTPENLGPTVNTEFDEDAPFIHPDGKTLFFSSDGHATMGGFDIFSTVYDSKKSTWSVPENIGYPINTADDDIYFTWSSDGTQGYFSSWRDDSYGEKDLYVIHRPKGSTNLVVLKGKVLNNELKVPIGATIVLRDLETNETKGVFSSNSLTGKYTIVVPHGKNYSLTIEAPGYVFYSENFNIPENNHFFSITKDINLDPIKVGSKIVLNNIFFDFDKATLRNESISELEKIHNFLFEYPDIKIEISGHTDNFGKAKYNEKLSDNRANAVVAYLIQRGIAKERLVAKGYGEAQPIASNENIKGRQLNRRTELKIIDQNKNLLKYYKDIEIEYVNQYTGKPSTASNSNTTLEKKKPTANYYWGETGPPVSSILRPKVHFLPNDNKTLTEYSRQRITNVIKAMDVYPSMKLKIITYTDSTENKENNTTLSLNRCKAVYNYMISKGVDPSRLSVETLEEIKQAEPVNTSEEKLKKRRVEFIVEGY